MDGRTTACAHPARAGSTAEQERGARREQEHWKVEALPPKIAPGEDGARDGTKSSTVVDWPEVAAGHMIASTTYKGISDLLSRPQAAGGAGSTHPQNLAVDALASTSS